MNIAVLIKQTPQVSEVTVTDKANWPDSELIVNPFDEYALEEALKIKETHDGKTFAISFGTDGAETALRSALALGIDEAYLIVDDGYTFLDPQKAAKALAKAVEKIGDIQMVLTGKQATDDDSAMMAPSVAAYLDWPQTGFVKKFDSVAADKVVCLRTTDAGYDKIETPLPAVFSVVKEINEPRLPSLKGKMKAKKAKIEKWTPADLGVELQPMLEQKSISAPPSRASGEIITGEKDTIIDKLVAKLKEDQVL
ncbi:MAG: electron transfer flavoprotein subunit beta/FixA family protein [candidate division Zixibacteria bacterium]|nr:electron transfer flavoprotein subunit beta/FixA family protein [candidate division Zixibacteria bacterium]